MGVGSTTIGIGVPITGNVATSSIGATTIDEDELTGIGWGRRRWECVQTEGEAFSVAPTGQQLTSTINFPSITHLQM